jgi:hypothetical protein
VLPAPLVSYSFDAAPATTGASFNNLNKDEEEAQMNMLVRVLRHAAVAREDSSRAMGAISDDFEREFKHTNGA